MSDTTAHGARFSRPDLPAAYDAMLVPHVFRPWADVLLAAVSPKPGEAVLDVACGPGTVARLAAKLVGPTGRVTGADVSAPMLAVARAKPVTRDMAPIEYVECPAQKLAVPDQAFDVAACQYAFELLPDREAAAAGMHRVLKTGGRLAISTWITRGPMPMDGLNQRLSELGVDVRRPSDLRDARQLQDLFVNAGFHSVRVEAKSLEIVWEGGVDQLMAALPASATWAAAQQLTAEQRNGVLAEFRDEMQALVRDGALRYMREGNITIASK